VEWKATFDPAQMVATLMLHDDLLFGLGAWSRGSKMLKLDATKPAATVLWETRKEPSTMHSTPVFQDDGHFYAILNDGSLACMNTATGDKVWSTQEPTSKRMGNAHLVRNGDHVFIFNHTGHLILAHLTPKGYEERGRCLLVEPTAGYRAQGALTWAHPAFANQCVFVRNDRELVCASLAAKDYTVIAGAKSQFKSSMPTGLPSGNAALAFSPDGKALAVGGSWGEGVKVIDVASNKPLPGPSPLKDFHCAVTYSPDGKWLIIAGGSEFTPARNGGKNTAQIKVFDIAMSKEIGELTGHMNKVFTAAISPDSHTLATGSADNTARLWDIATMKERAVLTGHTAAVMSVAFSPGGKTLATASADHTMKLWDVASGKMIQSIAAHDDEVRAIAFSPDGKLIATGSADSTVRLWDATTRKEVAVLRGHRGSINCLIFSPDGKTLASGCGDETIKLWRIAEAKESATLKGHRSAVTSIAFAPDARTLASAGMDDAVRVWELPVEK
jgi:WD40 repeat protein